MQAALDNVVALLDLEAIEVNIFRGRSPDDDRQRIFGGQVAGQALVAAARTVERGSVHSMHAYFLRAGDAKAPVLYDVDRITRRAVVHDPSRGRHPARPGHLPTRGVVPRRRGRLRASSSRCPRCPIPRPCCRELKRMQSQHPDRARPDRVQALDIRYVTTSPLDRTGPLPPTQLVWMRANGTLGDDPVLHACLLTYASDLTLLDTTLAPHGTSAADPSIMLASLDHAMWFHGPFRADEWLLYDQHTPAASGARGLATGRVFTHDGRLVVSVVQEGLIRPLR